MKLNQSKNCHVNYLAKIVEITNFTPHPDPEVTRLKCAHVDGYTIIVGIDEVEGKFVYFPTSSCINPQLLMYANLYRHSERNADATKTGLFEDNGRVKAVKLRGLISEGFLLPLQVMLNFILDSVNVKFVEDECPVGTAFDEIEHDGKSFWINKKYVVENQQHGQNTQKHYDKRQKKVKKFNRLIDSQFHFHYDTVRIQNEPYAIKPDDFIHMSHKWHGCVERNTIVDTLEYGKKTIGEIVDNKKECSIKSYNVVTGEIEYSPINNFYFIPNDGEWYEIELEDGRKITITGNNPVWLPELNCYRRVDELNGDEKLLID